MGVQVASPLRRNQGADKAVTAGQVPRRQPGIRLNTILAIGLWAMLWAGYNTGPWYVESPRFPASTMDLIHGLRAFFPMLAGWLALLLILTRGNLFMRWVVGPLGLLLLYAVVGFASSAFVSIEPLEAMYWGGNWLAIVLVLLAIVPVEDPVLDFQHVLLFDWIVNAILTISLLGAIPILGRQVITETQPARSVSERIGVAPSEILGDGLHSQHRVCPLRSHFRNRGACQDLERQASHSAPLGGVARRFALCLVGLQWPHRSVGVHRQCSRGHGRAKKQTNRSSFSWAPVPLLCLAWLGSTAASCST